MTKPLNLAVLPDFFAICRLDSDRAVPAWATDGHFYSITRTVEELSVVCLESQVPEGVRCEREWRCLRVVDTLDFSVIGVLASLVKPLAEVGVSVFAISTFDTDHLLVKQQDLTKACEAVQQAGHTLQ
jgi:hypothetical protein